MQQTVIRNTTDFLLTSYGNGLAYSLGEHNGLRRSIYLQGDDAEQFAAELAAMESAHPERDSDTILRDLFASYDTGEAPRKAIQPLNVPVRFFAWDEEANDGEGDLVECDEDSFLGTPYDITYERHTVFANGCSQICLTKMPKG